MRRASRLALAIGLALARRAWAGEAFEAVLVGASEVPGPGMEDGSVAALLIVEGTTVSLTLTPRGVRGPMSAHLHRGPAGVAGRLVASFPWTSGDATPRSFAARVSPEVAADLVARPGRYYVDVHTDAYPGGAVRGQLASRASAEPAAPPPPVYSESVLVEPSPWPEDLPRVRRLPAQSQRIPKKSQKIVGTVPTDARWGMSDFVLDISATSGLYVVFFASGDCEANGSNLHITGAGTCSLEAHQPGDPYYFAAPIEDFEFPIAKADQTIEFPELGGPYVAGGFGVPLYARASSGLPVSFGASWPCTVSGSSLQILDSGTCTVTAYQWGDRNFNPAAPVTRTVAVIVPPPPPPS